MIQKSYGDVTDDQVETYLGEYEKEMIARGFKWVAASEEGHDLFDTDTLGGKLKFWMIITIMRIVSLIGLFLSLFTGNRKPLLQRIDSSSS
jgi:hypothetical protein